jgi:hypothetical protein
MMFRALRELPLKESRQTLLKKIKWHIYKVLSRQPMEIVKIHEAHLRGLRMGLKMVEDYQAKKRLDAPSGQR